MAARVGKVIVGGLAVCVSYRLSNSTIETWSERKRFSHQRMEERLRQRPAPVDLRRDVMLERAGAAREKFDVVVVADCPRASQLALDCAVAGLRTLIIDSEDFNSNTAGGQESFPRETGTFSYLKSLFTDEELSWRDKLAVMFRGSPDFSLLTTAPYLSSVMRTEVVLPSLLQLALLYLADWLSDIVLHKAPQYTARLTSTRGAPAWYRPQSASYQTTQISSDWERLSLVRVLTAAHHGAAVINLVDITELASPQDGEESLLLSLEDKLTGRVIVVKTSKLIRLNRTCRGEEKLLHCFLLAGRLLEDRRDGYCWPQEDVVITRDQERRLRACVGSCSSHREAFDKLRGLISEVHIVRRSDLETVRLEARSDCHWSVETGPGVTSGHHSLLSPGLLQPPASPTLLLGSHGWSPHLAGLLQTRYGLSSGDSERLVRRWGDRAGDIARVASTRGLLAAEVLQACRQELCVSLQHLCARLRITDQQEVRAAARIMQAQLGWTSSTTDSQVRHCLQWLSSSQELQKWKLETEHSREEDDKFSLSQINIFKKMCREDGTISHGQLQDYLESEDSPCGERPLSDSQLDSVLRFVDIETNGKYSQDEFVALLRRIHVLTPEEVIEKHVDQIMNTNTNLE